MVLWVEEAIVALTFEYPYNPAEFILLHDQLEPVRELRLDSFTDISGREPDERLLRLRGHQSDRLRGNGGDQEPEHASA